MNNKQTEKWLQKANDDYISATTLMDKVFPPQIEIACYHCQQCVEKTLKAFCVENNIAFPRTHDLTILCNLCILKEPRFSSLLNSCGILSPYSTQTRYPNTMQVSESDARAAIKMAKKILNFTQTKILKNTYKKNTIQHWYINTDKTNAVLVGSFFNKTGFQDGQNGKTSPIQSVAINKQEKEYEIKTANTLYHCSFDSINFEEQDKSSYVLPDYEQIKKEYSKQTTLNASLVPSGNGEHDAIGD